MPQPETTTDTDNVPAGPVEVVGRDVPATVGAASLPAEVVKFLRSAQSELVETTEDAELSILDAILNADTVDAILARQEVSHLREWKNKRLTLHGLKFNKSTLGGAVGFYAMLQVSRPGEAETFLCSSGSKTVMAQAWQLNRLGLLPVDVVVYESETPTANGGYPMRLVAAPEGTDF